MNSSYDRTVDYSLLDPFKRRAQQVAATTDSNIERLGLEVVRESRGESAFLIRARDGSAPSLLATVPETLGTKNLVADAMRTLSGRTYYDAMAQDTVAMNVNDLITLGALPVVIGAHIAAGSSSWFDDEERSEDLVQGWKRACDLAGCVYGPGESPALVDLVRPDSAVLSGVGLGIIRSSSHMIDPTRLTVGDAIVLVASSGIHANGLTDARRLAERLPDGFGTEIAVGETFGDAILEPTVLYAKLIESCQDMGIALHYAVNITGHGWRKIMRAVRPFRYVLETLPPSSTLFDFLCGELKLSAADAYAKFNMGAGFALMIRAADVGRCLEAAADSGVVAWHAGSVESADSREVVIPSLGITFPEASLNLR